MSPMEAVITDPLKKTPEYKEAIKAVGKAKTRLDKTRDAAREDGRITRPERRQIRRRRGDLREARDDRKSIKNRYSDSRASAVDFDTEWMWDKVKEILSSENSTNQMWKLLHKSNDQLNTLLDGTNQIAEFAANNQALLQADAMRMSLLLGAPLPEKAADHVLIGDQREEVDPKSKGRRSLRIDQTTSPSLAI